VPIYNAAEPKFSPAIPSCGSGSPIGVILIALVPKSG
jgi:hypothetical protein